MAHVETLVVLVTMCFLATTNCESTISPCDDYRGIVSPLLHEVASRAQRRLQTAGGSRWKSLQHLAGARSGVGESLARTDDRRRRPFSYCKQWVFCQFAVKPRKRL